MLTVRDYKINCLQSDYKPLSAIIYNQINHVERCATLNIISQTDRNIYLKNLNETIKKLNITYNENISALNCDNMNVSDNYVVDDYDLPLSNLIDIIDIENDQQYFDDIREYVTMWKNVDTIFNPKIHNAVEILNTESLTSVRKHLCLLGMNMGFYNIETAIYLLMGINDKGLNIFDLEKLKLYNSVFVALEYYHENIDINNNDYDDKNLIKVRKGNNNKEIILDNYCEILLFDKKKNIKYVLKGYFDLDCLGIIIRTSQICHPFIHNKKKELEIAIEEIKFINARFKKIYTRNLTLVETLIHTCDSIKKKVNEDYEQYSKLIKISSFRALMTEFTKETNNLKNMYTIIKLLLFGSDESINFAGLLFGLTKDKKIGGEVVSEIIYKNLGYLLQTKLKKSIVTIKIELDKIKALTIDDVDLRKQLSACKNMPLYVKKCVSEKIEEMKTGSGEYYKQLTYVKMLINYPWPSENENSHFDDIRCNMIKCKEFLDSAKKTLDDMVYGHEGCKNAIQEMIAKWLSNPASAGKSIGLYGNPGIGKTLIAKGLGKALGIPFVQINLGGLDDGCVLCGHSYTYSAAQAGSIVKKMIEAGSSRCIMYFDELDKACKKHDVNEIYNILIHLTDPNTNSEFTDRFFQEINFPLNKVLFVFSYNNPDVIDKILRDRLQEIEVKPYSLSDKLIITKDFLLKEICSSIGLNEKLFNFTDDVIEFIIENHTHESGVRELKRKIESLFLKLNIDRYYNRGPFSNLDINNTTVITSITKDIVSQYLQKPKMNIRKIHSIDAIGITNGLYATTTGQGGIIPIIINSNFTGSTDDFILKMTGSQGNVMKESVEYSYTTAINLVKKEYRNAFLQCNKFGLHIHTPEGSTPKDGPSAGCAFTITFLSVILNKKIRRHCTLTGEIEPTGKVTAIGGLQFKLIGAKKAGATLVFVPKDNEEDYIEIKKKNPKLFDDTFNVMIIDNVFQVATHMLLEDDGSNFNVDTYLIINEY